MNPAAVQRYQLDRFKLLIKTAYQEVPMYRELYDSNHFDPSDVRQLEDVDLVPILTKEIIRQFPINQRVTARSLRVHVHKETTSGSTGEPVEIWCDDTESRIQTLKGLRFLREWGYSYTDNLVQVWRADVDLKKSALQKFGFLNRDFVSILDSPSEKVERIRNVKCDVLFASRSSLEILAEEMNLLNARVLPRFVVAGCEVLTPEHRKLFKEAFGCNTLEIYGCTEVGNVAWGCPSHPENLHVDMETVMVNYTHIQELADGTKASPVALTNLENAIMPFIRFDPGDDVTLPLVQRCQCGSTLPLLGHVNGRYDDIIEYKGRKLNFHYFYNYFKNYLYVRRYKVVQTELGVVEFRIQLHNDSEESRARCRRDLESAFLERFGPLNLRYVDEFPTTRSGKFKVIERLSSLRTL